MRPGHGLILAIAAPTTASLLLLRRCGTPCGSQGQFCCGSGEACTTLAGNVATCVGATAAYTTTWTETRTFTSTVMTLWAPAPEPTAGVDCAPAAPDQQACGPICCAGWQTCAFRGQCSVKPGFVEPSPVVVTGDGGQLTTQYSAPFRVTGTTTVTTSGVMGGPASASSTSAAPEAIGADAGTAGSGLSPGAIAGIVIGTIVGVALLLLLCFCCIARGLWAALCGHRRRRDRDRIDVYEERRSHHTHSRAPSAAHAVRKDRHSGWFGGPSRPASVVQRREKKSSGNWWLGVTAAAGTILALLNLKKDKPKPRPKVVPSHDSYSYYTYSDLTGPGSSSSDRRSNYTRRTADSRMPGPSHYSRSSRRP
ncbi:hypothetical protein CDD80_3216 [Ophiocordyceps camponoti-rufipedis]|uniref:Mid2 domain-containing protein n=1 Tax=Ophiocordyceps camponoti-rufipedis TaxID=2004952 RepID=A0A2C5Y849_9HYPO|nr:hypothetical protein CDD80_3216 [Ophiocordyceps camponoti-rufipedis]